MIRLVYDECNPTRDRRPTTGEDVENDIHVEEFNSVEDLMEELASLAGFDSLNEFLYEADLDASDSDAVISELLSYFDDPGDGSANIFYLNVDGKEFEDVIPYDSVAELDLSKATKEDIVKAILGDLDESLNESIENGYEINYSCWIDEEGNFGLDGDFDTEEEAIAYCKDNNYYSVEKQYFDGNERVKTEEIFINPDYVDTDEVANAYENDDVEYIDSETESEPWYKGSDDADYDVEFVDDDLEIDEDYSDEYRNKRYDRLIGRKIRIVDLDDPYASKYIGKEGVIENIATDPWGDVYFDGTWGSISIYPKVDRFEYVEEIKEAFVGKINFVEELDEFRKDRLKLHLSDDFINDIKTTIINNPNIGDVIPNTNGARKVRISLPDNGKGKSGGARVVYINVYIDDTAYLIGIYRKSDKEDLSEREKSFIRTIVILLKKGK